MKRCSVAKIRERRKELKKVGETNIEEYLKQLPSPPEEHTYELKMEKRLKRMLEEQEEKNTENFP